MSEGIRTLDARSAAGDSASLSGLLAGGVEAGFGRRRHLGRGGSGDGRHA